MVVPIRVVMAEDNYLVREGVRQLIESLPELELVAVCEDMDGLLKAVDDHNPEVILTDIRMPPTGTDEGLQVAEKLRVSHPSTGVVVLSQWAESDVPATSLSLPPAVAHRASAVPKAPPIERKKFTAAVPTPRSSITAAKPVAGSSTCSPTPPGKGPT